MSIVVFGELLMIRKLLSCMWPAGDLLILFEVGVTVTRGVTCVFILPMVFALLGNPVFNSMSQVWREFLGAF